MVTPKPHVAIMVLVVCAISSLSSIAYGQPNLRFSNGVIEAGATTDLLLVARVDGDSVFGVNVAFDLPMGITFVDVAPGIDGTNDIATDSFVATIDGIENVRALAYSTVASIADGSDIVLRVTLEATDDLTLLGISASETFDAPIEITASGLVGGDLRTSVIHVADNSVLSIKGPDAGPDGDVNGDGNVSAVDVQLVINAVLAGGHGDPSNDVNGDGSVDAIDIQLVINLVLGIGKDLDPALVDVLKPTGNEKFVRVLPPLPPENGAIPIGLNDYLYIRLHADTPISSESVAGIVESDGAASTDIGWIPISPSDGWAVYAPEYPWAEDESVSFRSWAMTIEGERIQSESIRFQVQRESKEVAVVRQPLVYEPGHPKSDGFVTVRTLSSESDIKKLADAITPVYYAGPGQAFSIPQRLWIPLDDPYDAQELSLYVYLPGEIGTQWHPALAVKDFLAERDATLLEHDGEYFYGVLINFGALVVLAP